MPERLDEEQVYFIRAACEHGNKDNFNGLYQSGAMRPVLSALCEEVLEWRRSSAIQLGPERKVPDEEGHWLSVPDRMVEYFCAQPDGELVCRGSYTADEARRRPWRRLLVEENHNA